MHQSSCHKLRLAPASATAARLVGDDIVRKLTILDLASGIAIRFAQIIVFLALQLSSSHPKNLKQTVFQNAETRLRERERDNLG